MTTDAAAPADLLIIDVDTHLSEPWDLWLKRAPAGLRGPRPAGQGGRRPAAVGLRRRTDRRRRCGVGHRRRHGEALRHGVHVRHPGARGRRRRLPGGAAPRADGRPGHLGPPHLPEHGRLRRPAAGRQGRPGPAQPRGRDLQRRDGRDAGRVGQPAVPAGDPAVVGRRPVPRRDRADPRPRTRRGEHELRPAGRRPARPQPAALGPDVGRARRRRAARQLPHRRQRLADHLPRVGAVAVDGRRRPDGDRLGDAVPRQRPDHRQPDLRRRAGAPPDAEGRSRSRAASAGCRRSSTPSTTSSTRPPRRHGTSCR